jgi:hypothetical protein
MERTLVVRSFPLEVHTNLRRDAYGSSIVSVDQTDQAREPEHIEAVLENRLGRLCAEPLPPAFFREKISDFDLESAVYVPWQQTAPADKSICFFVDCRPKAKFSMFWMSVQKPLELFSGLLVCQDALWEVAPYLWVTIQHKQIVQIAKLEVSQDESSCLNDSHEASRERAQFLV